MQLTLSPCKQTGVALLEVLISVIILSIGLLGLAALQARALQENQAAYQRTQANVLAYDIIDRMRANRPSVLTGKYNHTLGEDSPNGNSVTDSDLQTWLASLASFLPQGTGGVACTAATSQCVITVRWFDKSYNDDRDGDGDVDNTDKTLNIQMVSTL